LTKLDVLDGLDSLQICVGYRSDGRVSENPPLFADAFAEVEPVYEEMPGWKESTIGVTAYDALPLNARNYLERLQALAGVPIDIISTGPDRDQTIVLRHPFD
jgi:adenylosuccinate synthase